MACSRWILLSGFCANDPSLSLSLFIGEHEQQMASSAREEEDDDDQQVTKDGTSFGLEGEPGLFNHG